MMDFTTDDGLLRSAAGAAQWSALAQTDLARQDPDVDWIERAQLQLAADELRLAVGGITSAEGSLRIGKWLKANVAILGHFARGERDEDGHTLRLEVVDLDRADTLATRTIRVDGDRRDAVAVDPALARATAKALHEALAEARGTLTRATRQKVAALLFFHNADSSPRLDRFGPELADTFTRTAARGTDVRVLRFPQAEEARGEAELAVRGLTENDAEAWRRVADLYVWGSYHELPAPDAAFARTPVEIELTAWDGVNAPRRITERTAVADLSKTAQRLADQCLEAARRTAAGPPAAPEVRGTIARSLREQGRRLEETVDSQGTQRDAFLDTPEGKALARQRRLLLEAACFFAPEDRDGQLDRLRARWENFLSPAERLPLLDLWRRSNDLAEFAERFGGSDPDLAQARVDADAYLLLRLSHGEEQIHVPGSEPNLPIDASDADIAAWHRELNARFARDVAAYAKITAQTPPRDEEHAQYSYIAWMHAALQLTHDPAVAAPVVETIWPRHKKFYAEDPSRDDAHYGYRSGGLIPAVQALYAKLGKPERAAEILGALPAAKAEPEKNTAAPKTAAAAPGPRLPPLIPVFRPLRFPAAPDPENRAGPWKAQTAYVVQRLAVGGDDVLWVSAYRGSPSLSAPTSEQAQELWRYDPVDDSLALLPVEGLTRQMPITSILPREGGLWLTLGLNGVWQYDVAQERVIRRWTLADGLATTHMGSGIVDGDGRWYFAGRGNGGPLLNGFDPGKQEWRRVELPTVTGDAPAQVTDDNRNIPTAPPEAQVVSFQHWLCVRLGGSWTLVDTRTHRAQTLREALPATVGKGLVSFAERTEQPSITLERVPLPRPCPCAADAHGFWLAVDGKIVRFDPGHPETAKCWPLPEELADGVTAVAADGDDVWLAGPAGIRRPTGDPRRAFPQFGWHGKGFIAVLHEADGKWRGCFELPAPVGCLAMGRQTVYADQQMAAQPLVEIDKSASLAGVR